MYIYVSMSKIHLTKEPIKEYDDNKILGILIQQKKPSKQRNQIKKTKKQTNKSLVDNVVVNKRRQPLLVNI